VRTRHLAAFGVLAAVQMIAFVSVDEALRPGYDPARNWISQLSLGPGGELAAANLATCGLWLVLAGAGLRPRAGRRTAALVMTAGASLALLAFVRTDPGIGYPPGVPAVHTVRGLTHQGISVVLGVAGVFAAAGLDVGRFKKIGPAVAALMAVTFTAGSALVWLDAADVLPGNPSGLLERVALYAGLLWIAVVSAWATWGSSGPGPGGTSSTDRAGPARTSGADREKAPAGPGS
jgi:hypothetical protein